MYSEARLELCCRDIGLHAVNFFFYSLLPGRSRPPITPRFSVLSSFPTFVVSLAHQSSSSPLIFALVFPVLFYPSYLPPLVLFEESPFSLYIPSSSVVSFLLSLTEICLSPFAAF